MFVKQKGFYVSKSLNEKQSQFVLEFVRTGSARQAAETAGYAHASVYGPKLKRELATHIERAIRETISDSAAGCVHVLQSIAYDEKAQQAVRVKAAESLLSRAGYDAVQKVEQTNVDSNVTDKDLQQQLSAIMGRMNSKTLPAGMIKSNEITSEITSGMTSLPHPHTPGKKTEGQPVTLADTH